MLVLGVVGVVADMAGGVVGIRWGKLALIGEVPTRTGHMSLDAFYLNQDS